MKKIKILGLLGCLLLGSACNTNTTTNLNILTTVYPTEYIVSTIYPEGVITSIYPDGADIKNYSLTEKQVKEYSNNDIFIYNGLSNELEIAKNLINQNKNLHIIDVAYGLKYEYGTEELWLSPNYYLMLATTIKENLEEQIDSKYVKEEIESNYKELEETLSIMDAELRSIAESASDSKKTLVVSSNMFKYLENYGFTVISLEDGSVSESSLKSGFKNKTYTTIFMKDTEEKTELISKLENDYNANIIKVNTMATLEASERTNKENYLTIMKEYIENIRTVALGS